MFARGVGASGVSPAEKHSTQQCPIRQGDCRGMEDHQDNGMTSWPIEVGRPFLSAFTGLQRAFYDCLFAPIHQLICF